MKFINNKEVVTESVGTLLLQPGQEGSGVDNNFTEEIQKEVKSVSKKKPECCTCENTEVTMESVQDTIYNYKTSVPIDRTTRKMIYKIYKTEEDIKRAIANGKDKSVITDLKREVVRLRKNFNNAKRGMKSNEVSEIKKIERAAISELKKMTYKESVNEVDSDVVTEAFTLADSIPLIFLATTVVSLAAFSIKEKMKLKKVLKYYAENNKDCVDFTSLKKKTFTIKSLNKIENEDLKNYIRNSLIKDGDNCNMSISCWLKGDINKNSNVICGLINIIDIKPDGFSTMSASNGNIGTAVHYSTSRKCRYFVHNDYKKHDQYYINAMLFKNREVDAKAKMWAEDLYVKYKLDKKEKDVKESVDEDDIITESFSDFLKKIKNFSFKKVKVDPVDSLGKDDKERIKNVLALYSKKYKDAPDITKLNRKKVSSKEIDNVKDEETRELLKSLDSYFSSNFKSGEGDNEIDYWEDDNHEIIFGAIISGNSGNIFINPKYSKHSNFLKSSLTVLANDYPADAINWAKEMYKVFDLDIKDMKESVIDSLSSLSVDLIQEKADLDEEMKPIVDKLNEKGYKVKYASPGHKNLRKKEDKEPDGVYEGKLYSDARIMFDKEYNMGEAPEGWKWRTVDGCSYLDIKDKTHDPENDKRTPDEIFSEWKKEYMDSLRKFVDELKPNGSSNDDSSTEKESPVEESVDDIINDLMETFLS